MNEQYNSDFEVRYATYVAIGGDAAMSTFDSVYDIDLAILAIEQQGGGGTPDAYLKSASVSGNTLTLVNKDDTTVQFTPQGGGGGTSDIKTYVLNDMSSDEIIALYNSIHNTNSLGDLSKYRVCIYGVKFKATQTDDRNKLLCATSISKTDDNDSVGFAFYSNDGNYERYYCAVNMSSTGGWIVSRKLAIASNDDIPQVEQSTGTSTSNVMSQKAVTDAIAAAGEPDAYIKNASVSGNTLTLTNKDDTTVQFTPQGGGGGLYYYLPDMTQEEIVNLYNALAISTKGYTIAWSDDGGCILNTTNLRYKSDQNRVQCYVFRCDDSEINYRGIMIESDGSWSQYTDRGVVIKDDYMGWFIKNLKINEDGTVSEYQYIENSLFTQAYEGKYQLRIVVGEEGWESMNIAYPIALISGGDPYFDSETQEVVCRHTSRSVSKCNEIIANVALDNRDIYRGIWAHCNDSQVMQKLFGTENNVALISWTKIS